MHNPLLSGSLALFFATGAVAQQASTPPAPAPAASAADAETGGIQRVVVTATKRQSYVRDIAGSVSANTGGELERAGSQQLEDFIKLTPGVQLSQEAPDQQRVSIRGVAANSQLITQTTGIFIGEAPFTDAYLPRVSPDVNPFDLSVVEVLKGPQGTLFGGSALNGAIRYVPMKPKLGQSGFKYFAQYNKVSHGEGGVTVGGAANLPLGESAALRFVALDRRIPGYIDNTSTGVRDANSGRQNAYRLLATWQPTARLTLEGLVWRQDTDMDGWPITDNLDGRLVDAYQQAPGWSKTGFELATVSATYAFDDFDLLLTGSRSGKTARALQDNSPAAGLLGLPGASLATAADTEIDGTVAELRLTSTMGGAFSWIAGVYRQTTEVNELGDNLLAADYGPFPAGTSLFAFPARVKATESAVYGEVAWSPMKDLELTFGGRYHRNETSGDISVRTLAGTVTNAGEVSDSGFEPKVSARYTLSPQVQLWALLNRGYRFGGLNTPLSPGLPSTYRSDQITNFEVGLRTEWLKRRLQADVTVYKLDWKNPQNLTYPDPLTNYIDNVGQVDGQGVELALQWAPEALRGFTARASAAYNDLKTATPFTLPGGAVAPAGTRWTAASRSQTALDLSYETGFGAWTGGVDLRYAYVGRAPSDLANTYTLFGYETVDLMFTVRPSAGSAWPTLSLGVTNLGDTRALVSGLKSGSPAPFADRAYYNQPRTAVFRLSGSF